MSIRNTVKQIAGEMLQQQAALRYGTVTNVDSVHHRVKVNLTPENVVTGWLSVATTAAGAGWGLTMMPTAGMQVAVMGTHGSNDDMLVIGAVHSEVDMPASVPNAIGTGGRASTSKVAPAGGELVAVHSSGATLRMCADGSIYMRGNVNIDGTLRVNGDVFDYHGSLDRLRQNYDAHGHNYYAGSSPSTTAPTDHVDPE